MNIPKPPAIRLGKPSYPEPTEPTQNNPGTTPPITHPGLLPATPPPGYAYTIPPEIEVRMLVCLSCGCVVYHPGVADIHRSACAGRPENIRFWLSGGQGGY